MHPGVALPAGQVLPATEDDATAVSTRSAGSGSRTVTDAVTVALAPTARSPLHTRVPGPASKTTVPVVADPLP